MLSSLGTSSNAGFFNCLREVPEPCSKGTYSTFGLELPMIETVLVDGLSSAGLGDPRALGTVNNSW